MGIISQIKNVWNIFTNKNQTVESTFTYTTRPSRVFWRSGQERSILASIYNRIAVDASTFDIKHVKLNSENHYEKDIQSPINTVLTLTANQDQDGRSLIMDAVYSLLEEGCVAIVPVDADRDPFKHTINNVYSMRVAQIVEWHRNTIGIMLYNERSGQRERVLIPKTAAAIIENPFYSIMNEPNSTLQRLKKKLALLDFIDEKTASKKLDLIIQFPYQVRSDFQKEKANQRISELEHQLGESNLGIAYTDGTERITQLNRPVENSLLSQVQYLQDMLYTELGITKEILNGTASEDIMNNYYKRTIEPLLSAIVNEFKRKFLTKTAITQGQTFMFFYNPFKMVTLTTLANIVPVLTTNEIISSNDVRSYICLPPSDSPGADDLLNKNINPTGDMEENDVEDPSGMVFNEMLDGVKSDIESLFDGGLA
jgi:hypothetical protein